MSNNDLPKSRPSMTGMMSRAIAQLSCLTVFLILIIFVIVTVGSGLWLQTFKAFTKEELVAILEVEEKKFDASDTPYFKITYTPVDNPSALTEVLVDAESDSDPDEVIAERQEFYLYGDRVMVESEVINFNDWATLLGVDTIYKITRIRGEYTDIEDEKNKGRTVYDINGGIDPVWETLEYNQESLEPLVEAVYGSSVSQSARPETKKWGIYMTEDGLIMKSYDE